MQLIEFRDNCVISRGGGKDEWDNPTNPEIVYEGPCLYEEGGSGMSRSLIARMPTVYLPKNDALVLINDSVSIVTEKGRKIESVAKIVRDINMPWQSQQQLTRIELKQAKGE